MQTSKRSVLWKRGVQNKEKTLNKIDIHCLTIKLGVDRENEFPESRRNEKGLELLIILIVSRPSNKRKKYNDCSLNLILAVNNTVLLNKYKKFQYRALCGETSYPTFSVSNLNLFTCKADQWKSKLENVKQNAYS